MLGVKYEKIPMKQQLKDVMYKIPSAIFTTIAIFKLLLNKSDFNFADFWIGIAALCAMLIWHYKVEGWIKKKTN